MSWPKTNISLWRLGIEPRWFTGKQWADGTAETEQIKEFNQKFKEFKKTHNRDGSPKYGIPEPK